MKREDVPNTNKTLPASKFRLPTRKEPKTQTFPPILIVCYTNHALDQFLEGMIPFCQDLVRIGGNSKSELLNEFNLRSLGFRMRDTRGVPEHIFKNIRDCDTALKENLESIKRYEKTLMRIRENKHVLKDRQLFEIVKLFSLDQYNSFVIMVNKRIPAGGMLLFWLGFQKANSAKSQEVNKMVQIRTDKDTYAAYAPIEYQEMDADEEEINFIQNHRMADFYEENYSDYTDDHGSNDNIEDEVEYEMVLEDGFQFQKHQQKRQLRNIQYELSSSDRMSMEEAASVKNVWSLNHNDRWRLYRFWVELNISVLEEMIWKNQQEYSVKWEEMQALRNEEDLYIVRNKKIIGMTTTGAAKYRHIIDGVQPRIISKPLFIYTLQNRTAVSYIKMCGKIC